VITLKEGDRAPSFTGIDQAGNKISLANHRGHWLVLYFYSEAGSPTCTIESCNLRDHYAALKKKGLEIIGVSPDTQKAQQKFAEKFKLPFPLIADTDNRITEAYGVRDMKKLFGRTYMGILRTTFLLDEKGIIRKIFFKPKNKAHAEEILQAFENLRH
jgi:thioredoxin-dependent peroxiredoxin